MTKLEEFIQKIYNNVDVMFTDSEYYDKFMETDPIIPLSFDEIINKTSMKEYYDKSVNTELLITVNENYKLPSNLVITLLYYKDCLLHTWLNIHLTMNNGIFNQNKYDKISNELINHFNEIIAFYQEDYDDYCSTV